MDTSGGTSDKTTLVQVLSGAPSGAVMELGGPGWVWLEQGPNKFTTSLVQVPEKTEAKNKKNNENSHWVNLHLIINNNN